MGASALEACWPLTVIRNPAAQKIRRPKLEYQSISFRLHPFRLTFEANSEAERPISPEIMKKIVKHLTY